LISNVNIIGMIDQVGYLAGILAQIIQFISSTLCNLFLRHVVFTEEAFLPSGLFQYRVFALMFEMFSADFEGSRKSKIRRPLFCTKSRSEWSRLITNLYR
jgi:hypothetical protein